MAKRGALADILEDVDEPVVVFCRFVHELDQVHIAAGKTKLPCWELSGHASELPAWRDDCGEGNRPVLAVQIQSGSEGISLTEASLAVYWWSTTYSAGSRTIKPRAAATAGPDAAGEVHAP